MGSRIIHYMTYWWNGWEWGNGMIITSDYGSFPHSLLSTSKMIIPKIFAQPGCWTVLNPWWFDHENDEIHQRKIRIKPIESKYSNIQWNYLSIYLSISIYIYADYFGKYSQIWLEIQSWELCYIRGLFFCIQSDVVPQLRAHNPHIAAGPLGVHPSPDTLWLFNIAMENGPFIDDFPIKTSIYKGFSMAILNNQRASG